MRLNEVKGWASRDKVPDRVGLPVQFMQAFDGAMQALDERYHFLASPHQLVSCASEEEKVSAHSPPCFSVLVSRLSLDRIFSFWKRVLCPALVSTGPGLEP